MSYVSINGKMFREKTNENTGAIAREIHCLECQGKKAKNDQWEKNHPRRMLRKGYGRVSTEAKIIKLKGCRVRKCFPILREK